MTHPFLQSGSIDNAVPAPAFSRTEQMVLDIAWRDGHRGSRMQRMMDRIFGGRPPLPLGNEKLEALRQYGVQLRRLGARAVPAAATAALMAAGYGAEQIDVLHMTFSAFSGAITAHGHNGERS